MRFVAEDWLLALFASTAVAQVAFGSDWLTVSVLAGLFEIYPALGALASAHGVELTLVFAGALGYVSVRLAEVEFLARPIDERGRVIPISEETRVMAARRLEILGLSIRGHLVERDRTA